MQVDDKLIEKFFTTLYERQESINKQMDEGEKKYFQRLEESKRILEESERKFFDRLEEKKRHLDETEIEFYRRLEANRILFESIRGKEEQEAAKRLKKKFQNFKIEMADHPVYAAIIRLFSERGYQLDDETLNLYWELVTAVAHFSEQPPPKP